MRIDKSNPDRHIVNDDTDNVFILNNRQHYFLREIGRLNYNKDEAYAEIISSKRRFQHYDELEEVIRYYFDERPDGRLWRWKKD